MDGFPAQFVRPVAEWCAAMLECVGVVLILALGLAAIGSAVRAAAAGTDAGTLFQQTRHLLIRSILLGLEFLVAADIIHTVAVELTFKTVSVLAIIVVIRTFLSFALELEMTGRWPWQGRSDRGGSPAGR
jgi:uncharacterized membrane protein